MRKEIIVFVTAMALAASSIVSAAGNPGEAQAKKKASVKVSKNEVKITKKNFPDTVFRELVRVNYDKNKDKKLSASEIKKAKKFGSSSCKNYVKIKASKYGKYETKYVRDIKNFKGIEKLTYLQKFVAASMSVKTVNFKKNTQLKYLEMQNGKLQKLDLNANTKLEYVYLQYNPLTTLKINKCKKLKEVDLTGHMVKNLKINRNKKTRVYGEEYYVPYTETKITTDFANLNNCGVLDSGGKYCVYEWSSDYTSCTKKTLAGNQMTSSPVVLDSNTVNRAKTMQKITAQWQDEKGNFFFVGDQDGNMAASPRNYVFKVNAQGAIEKEVFLNNWLQVPEVEGVFRYNLYQIGQKDNIVAFRMENRGQDLEYSMTFYGVVLFDMEKMEVTTQADCNFRPEVVEGDVVAGVDNEVYHVVTCKLVGGEKIKVRGDSKESAASEGTQKTAEGTDAGHEIIYYGKEAMAGNLLLIPERPCYTGGAVAIAGNNIYLINGRGFFKAKLTDKSFTQVYGVGRIKALQDPEMEKYSMVMKDEKEIYLLFTRESEEKTTYDLSQCKIG